jgi:hypothetical protein
MSWTLREAACCGKLSGNIFAWKGLDASIPCLSISRDLKSLASPCLRSPICKDADEANHALSIVRIRLVAPMHAFNPASIGNPSNGWVTHSLACSVLHHSCVLPLGEACKTHS